MSSTPSENSFYWRNPQRIFLTAWRIAAHPLLFFRGMTARPRPADSLAFFAAMHLSPLALAGLFGLYPWSGAAWRLLLNLAEGVFLAGALHLAASRLFKGEMPWPKTLAIFCYSAWPWLLTIFAYWLAPSRAEIVLMALLVVSLAYLLVGLRCAARLYAWQSVGALIVAVLSLFICEFLLAGLAAKLGWQLPGH